MSLWCNLKRCRRMAMQTSRVQVRFMTKLDHSYIISVTSIAIPANLTRLGLSIFVNNLLQTGNPEWEPEPFDFLIDGELVRMSFEQFLLAKGMSAEKTVEIEYIRALVPRKQEEPSLHDVRVSSIDGSYSGVMLKVMCLSRRENRMINLSNLNGSSVGKPSIA